MNFSQTVSHELTNTVECDHRLGELLLLGSQAGRKHVDHAIELTTRNADNRGV